MIPDLGVFVSPGQLALDYRMGGWSPEQLEALFRLLLEIAALDPGLTLSPEEWVAPTVTARFRRSWSRFVLATQ